MRVMRRIAYQALLKAPFRIASGASTALGFVGTFWPDKVKAMIGNGVPVQPIGIALLLASAIYFLLLWLLKPGEKDGGSGTTVTTGGPYSPAVGSVGGNLTQVFNPPPAEKSPYEMPPPKSPWDDPTFRLTSAALANAIPDMELREVCVRLYDSFAQLVADFETRVDLEIKDNVRFRDLHTWGRRKAKDGLNDVWKDAWLTGDFSHKRGSLIFRHPDNPAHPVKWTDLRFNRAEVDQWLPPKPEYGIYIV